MLRVCKMKIFANNYILSLWENIESISFCNQTGEYEFLSQILMLSPINYKITSNLIKIIKTNR